MNKEKTYNVTFNRIQAIEIEVTIPSTGDNEQDIDLALEKAEEKLSNMDEQAIKECLIEDGDWEVDEEFPHDVEEVN